MSKSSKKLVWGVGVNDADYCVKPLDHKGKKQLYCPFYERWKGMLKRCYGKKFQEKSPTYIGCSVCDEWLIFSNFRIWMDGQDWAGKQLDKDLLVEGNKEYSPDNCVFVTSVLNTFMNDSSKRRGEYMIGVYLDNKSGKFRSECRNPISKKKDRLGYFYSELDAHKAWKKHKLKLVEKMLDNGHIDDMRIYENLKNKYSAYV